jgi:hypothetical protein
MTEPDELAKARTRRKFDASPSTKHLDPRDALVRALDAIDSGDIAPHHIIVVVGSVDEEQDIIGVRFFSAGALDHWGHIGLMSDATDEIKKS